MHRLLDTEYIVETPEAIDLSAQLAGPVPRALAYSIDFSIRTAIIFVLFIVLLSLERAGMGLFFLISFLLEWFYPLFFEFFRKGQTPGKRFLRIAVVNRDLTPVTFGAATIRNLLRAVDFLPLGYFLGMVSMTISRNFQRFGDLAAGTIVIHCIEYRDKLNLPDVTPTPPPIAVSLEDQIALAGFAQRHDQLSEQRKQELADLLSDVIHKDGPSAVTFLQGVGCWLLGDKRLGDKK